MSVSPWGRARAQDRLFCFLVCVVKRITLGKGACSRHERFRHYRVAKRITLGKGACSRPVGGAPRSRA